MTLRLRRDRPIAAGRIAVGRLGIDVVTGAQAMLAPRRAACASAPLPYIFAVPLEGTLSFGQNGRSGTVGVAEYVLLDPNTFHHIASDQAPLVLVLHIPAAELRARVGSLDDHLAGRFPANRCLTRLLVDLLGGVTELFAERGPPNPEALATEIIGFVALVIEAEDRGAACETSSARYQLRRRINDFIDAHLADPDLSPKRIAASARISLSYLYSLFHDNGETVGHVVQAKRLQRAYGLLALDPRGHRTVAEVAYEVGFKNVSHFSRSFSARFGKAPRDLRQGLLIEAQARDAEPAEAAATRPHAPRPL